MNLREILKEKIEEREKRLLKEEREEGEKPEGMTERTVRYPGGVLHERFETTDNRSAVLKNPLTGVLFLAWFIGSIVALLYAFNRGDMPGLGVALFGQIFFVFGVVFALSKQKIGVIFSLFGGTIVAGGLIFHYGNKSTQQLLTEKMIPIALCSVFILVGVGFLIRVIQKHVLLKNRCTQSVMAKCTYIAREIIYVQRGSGDDRRSVPTPMWVAYYKYYYNGVYYYADCIGTPVHWDKPLLEDCREVKINPNNPKEYYETIKRNVDLIIGLIFGIGFPAAGAFALYCFLGM